MTKLTRKTAILAKIETTYGTNATPTGSANAIQISNPEITPIAAETVNRSLSRSYLGTSEALIANSHVEMSFDVEIAGSGDANTPAPYSVLLRACGLAETIWTTPAKVTYDPVSSGFESVTIYLFKDGLHHKVTGCRGSVSFEIESGKIPYMKFKFLGIYVPIVDAGMPTTDYTNWQKPYVSNSTYTNGFSFFGVSGLILEKFMVDLGNSTAFRSLIGSEYVMISDRQVTGSVVFEATSVSTLDIFDKALDTNNGVIQITHGGPDGHKFKIQLNSADIGNPTYADSGGVLMMSVPFSGIPITGNDELILTTF